ncbi:MAG: cupin domain-containing protein [Alphaproteobacteria bacterium]|nr:cupin domain-containing protein [Alphaproteobacteria bacterium]MCB9791174.1 cupin domain-containing protein [Alphaproteobacteria bacterium]
MRRVEKPWGHEEIWASTDAYLGKILFIKEGHRLSLQHHVVKEETIRVASGRMLLELEDEAGVLVAHELGPGDVAHIPPGRRHRMRGLSDCHVYEVSTAHGGDVVRHEDDYGRAAGLAGRPLD